jgi:hypothetical protein
LVRTPWTGDQPVARANTNIERTETYIHVSSEIQTHDPSVPAGDDISCLMGPIHDQSCCAKMFCATQVCPFTINRVAQLVDRVWCWLTICIICCIKSEHPLDRAATVIAMFNSRLLYFCRTHFVIVSTKESCDVLVRTPVYYSGCYIMDVEYRQRIRGFSQESSECWISILKYATTFFFSVQLSIIHSLPLNQCYCLSSLETGRK